MSSLDDFAAKKLHELEARQLRRSLHETTRIDGPWMDRDGRRFLSFSCNDYLNLSHHPLVQSLPCNAMARAQAHRAS
jgi:8-amino-7-oxononanoate synthase